MKSKPKYIGIRIAREILSGDFDQARKSAERARQKNGACWEVCEVRAIMGAIREAERRWDIIANSREFLGW